MAAVPGPAWPWLLLVGVGVAAAASSKQVKAALLLVAACACGWGWAAWRCPQPPPAIADPLVVQLRGVVASWPEQAQGRTRFDLDCREGPCGRARVRVVCSATARVERGDVLAVRGRLERPDSAGNPGAFDYRAYLERHGVFHLLYVRSPADLRVCGAQRGLLAESILRLRQRSLAAMDGALPPVSAALLRGMVLGDCAAVDEARYRDFQKTGLVHLLAVSGMNVAFLLGGVEWCGALLGWRGTSLLLVQLAAMGVYGCLVGWPVSLVRASLMAGMGLLAWRLGREPNALNALCLAGTGVLLWQPAWLRDIGFQLSFLSTAGIVCLFPPLRAALPAGGAVRDLLLVSLCGQLAAMPAVVHHFGILSLSALPANLLATWLVGATVLLGMAGVAAAAVWPPAACLCLRPAGLAASLIDLLARRLAALPGSCLWVAQPHPLVEAAGYAGLVMAAVGLSRGTRGLCRAGLGLLALFLLVALAPWQWWQGSSLQVWFLDVGQGDAALVRTPCGRALLIDTGGSLLRDVGDDVLVPALRRQGIRTLDLVLVSHPDVDHIGGLGTVARELRVGAVAVADAAYPGPAFAEAVGVLRSRRIPVLPLAAGQRLRLDPALEVAVLAPAAGETAANANDLSLVLEIRHGSIRFLFPGDAGSAPLHRLAASGRISHCTVLKVPHHGSRGSWDEAFYRAASPRLAVISVGAGNRFGHPAADTLAGLTAHGARVLRTDRDGAVRVESDGRRLRVTTTRRQGRRTGSRPQGSLYFHPGIRIEGVGAHLQREEERVALPQVLHVVQPLGEQWRVGARDVGVQVLAVAGTQVVQRLAEAKFLDDVEDGPQHVSEGLVLQQHGVFQQAEQEVTLVEDEVLEALQLLPIQVEGQVGRGHAGAAGGELLVRPFLHLVQLAEHGRVGDQG
jgi:competence protein ComEC